MKKIMNFFDEVTLGVIFEEFETLLEGVKICFSAMFSNSHSSNLTSHRRMASR